MGDVGWGGENICLYVLKRVDVSMIVTCYDSDVTGYG